jgi:hypothetical protein
MIAAERCMLNIDDVFPEGKGIRYIDTCISSGIFQFTNDPLQNIDDIQD